VIIRPKTAAAKYRATARELLHERIEHKRIAF